jgi:hypothetical protein
MIFNFTPLWFLNLSSLVIILLIVIYFFGIIFIIFKFHPHWVFYIKFYLHSFFCCFFFLCKFFLWIFFLSILSFQNKFVESEVPWLNLGSGFHKLLVLDITPGLRGDLLGFSSIFLRLCFLILILIFFRISLSFV